MIISPFSASGDLLKVLSPQQTIIMQRLANGETVKEIALSMMIARTTVRKYVTVAKRKMGAKTHDQAIALAVARGEVIVSMPGGQAGVVYPLDKIPVDNIIRS